MFLPLIILAVLATESLSAVIKCPPGYENVSGACFHFYLQDTLPWAASRNVCKGMGGDLAIINDCKVFKNLVRFITMNSSLDVPEHNSYWIGGSDSGQEGRWFWVDGSPMAKGLPFWGSVNGIPEPSGGEVQNCALLFKDDRYYFHDGECNKIAFPLCQTFSFLN